MVRRSAALVEGRHFEWKSSEADLHAAQGLDAQDIVATLYFVHSVYLLS